MAACRRRPPRFPCRSRRYRPPCPHQQSTVLHVRARDLLDARGTLLPRHNRHRAHMRIVASGYRIPSSARGDDGRSGDPDYRVMASSPPRLFDVVVVGAGPAGVVAALRAARLGASTALITRDQFGGMAANDGPVPVRTLAQARQLPLYGIAGCEPSLDYPRLLARVREVTEDARQHTLLRDDLERAGVDIREHAGTARFVDADTVESDNAPRLRAG